MIEIGKTLAITSAERARIVVIGAGGLGTPAAWGVISGWPKVRFLELVIIDPDKIELSNLNRQILFSATDVGANKAQVLSERVTLLQQSEAVTSISITAIPELLTKGNISELLAGASFVIDATDSVETKFLVNDFCVINRIPFVYGGVLGLAGQALIVNPKSQSAACLRCLFGDFTVPDYEAQETSCRQAGIIGAVAGVIGFCQAEAALAYLLGPPTDSALPSQLIRFDGTNSVYSTTDVLPSIDCPLSCGQRGMALDIRDKQCPTTFLYTKLALEKIAAGGRLTVRLGSKKSAENVSRTLIDEGYKLSAESRELYEGVWQLDIVKPG